ncbi:hypothetical protein LTR01_001472 [Friedmanniomyces endolithicus]|nr:hypothetical protein LTR01_001472 [Friedmanniomyces endolithicus]KAK0830894.1 hypothetical protein LTR73_003281 [Friedmanniomyces endolithicus]
MPEDTILYDLPSKGRCSCWSLNPWKARLALNYKAIPYRTEWVEYPDLKPTLSALGIPPNPPGTNNGAVYSSPAVRFSDGTYVMDSDNIVHALDRMQPEPSLHLDNGYTDRVQAAVLEAHVALVPINLPRVPVKLLRPASREYFETTREKRFGMPLEELAKSEKAGESAWKAAEPGMEKLRAILHEHEEGPYVMGKTVSFADFHIAGFWRFVQVLDEDGDVFDRGMRFDESFPKHFDACKEWLRRDD